MHAVFMRPNPPEFLFCMLNASATFVCLCDVNSLCKKWWYITVSSLHLPARPVYLWDRVMIYPINELVLKLCYHGNNEFCQSHSMDGHL